MVSPQERQTIVSALLGTGGGRSMAGVKGVSYGMRDPTENRRERYRTLSHRCLA
jgi:hypothetical protein